MAGLFHRLGEHRAVFFGQVQDTDDGIQHLGGIAGALAGDGHVEAGLVVRQQHAVAVVDKTALGGDGQHMHPVVLGHRGVVVELGDLQKIHATDQGAADSQHQRRTGDQSFIDQPFFGFVIFKRDRLRHSGGSREKNR